MRDSTMPHVAQEIQAFQTKRNVQLVKQPADSPDLNLRDRYLFRKVNYILRSRDFEGHEYVKDNLQRLIKSLPEDVLYQ